MEENMNMTAERSLEIMRESIERSQRTIAKNSSLSMIWWGACVVVCALLIAFLWAHHGGPVWNFLWILVWGLGYVGEWFIAKRKEAVPETIVSKTIGQVWGTFGIFCCAIGVILGLVGCGIIPVNLILPDASTAHLYINITSIISLCFGIASAITGAVLKNRIIQACGIIAGLGGFFGALRFPWVEQLYVMVAVAVIGLIVPGCLIYFQNKK